MAKQKILIADDEAQIREILRIYFEKEGFEVIEAEDGAAAILKVQSEKPDILLLDIMMPVLDGIEVCKQVRKMSYVYMAACIIGLICCIPMWKAFGLM